MAAFESVVDELAQTGISVTALSCDGREQAAATVAELGLRFPVGYGVDLEATATVLGAYYEPRRGILHATGFLLRPNQSIAVAVYSSGAVGRLIPGEIFRVVTHWTKTTG